MLLLLLLTTFLTPPDSPVEWLGKTTLDAGDVPHGEDLHLVFRFKNLTDEPLFIDNVREGCGCTATDWRETPVAPGAEGSINVTYDAMNVGYFRKNVKVFFRGHRGGHKLWLEGFVED
ncbi:MAG: DUF1573 domain-containing protein [Bacteroidota bacterium]